MTHEKLPNQTGAIVLYHRARSAVTRLAATDLAAASGIELDEMRYAVECLLRSIERLDAARLLPPERCAEALEAVRSMVAGLCERCADPV